MSISAVQFNRLYYVGARCRVKGNPVATFTVRPAWEADHGEGALVSIHGAVSKDDAETVRVSRLEMLTPPRVGAKADAKFCLRLPPELWDGDHYGIMPMHDADADPAPIEDPAWMRLSDHMRNWAEHSDPGDEVTISVVHMTQEEIDALPEC